MSYKMAVDIRRKAADRERKRLVEERQKNMKGYAQSSISVIDKLKGVKKWQPPKRVGKVKKHD